MKRLHIHIAVDKLSENIHFYSAIFGVAPTTQYKDYVKWQLNNPAVNFVLSNRGEKNGINHLGIQVDTETELLEIQKNLEKASIMSAKQENTSCCYANSNKHWALDPQGVAWEAFHTLCNIAVYAEKGENRSEGTISTCCIPSEMKQTSHCG
jgi:catechol-2,3-dioxygenase